MRETRAVQGHVGRLYVGYGNVLPITLATDNETKTFRILVTRGTLVEIHFASHATKNHERIHVIKS